MSADPRDNMRRAVVTEALWRNRYRLAAFTSDDDWRPMYENVAAEIVRALHDADRWVDLATEDEVPVREPRPETSP